MSAPKGPAITVERVTPTVARQYLESNTDNRTIRSKRVALYSRQMENGQWLMAGDPIRFDATGKLIDGQHRLLAIIQYGKPVDMVVMRDVSSEAFKIIDSGLQRTGADALGAGVAGGANKAAICRVMFVYDLDGDPRRTEDMSIVTRPDVFDYYKDHHEEVDAGNRAASRLRSAIGSINQTGWAAMHIVAYRTDEEAANEFVEGVTTGAHLGAGDPRLALRNWLSNQRGRGFANAGWHFALFLKAWNSYMLGEQRQILMIKPDEPFPHVAKLRRLRNRGGDTSGQED